MLDLTMQRTSLARFGTALGTMLDRFERIAGQLETAPEPTMPPAIEGDVPEPEHETPAAQSFFSDDRISLEELRLSFAELIAKQIMDNTIAQVSAPACALSPNH